MTLRSSISQYESGFDTPLQVKGTVHYACITCIWHFKLPLLISPASRSCDFRPVRKSVPFRAGQSLNPYLPRYREAFTSSDISYPHTHGLTLLLAFLKVIFKEIYGLTKFRFITNTRRLRSHLSAGAATSTIENGRASIPGPLPFGSSLSVSLACCSSRHLSVVHMC